MVTIAELTKMENVLVQANNPRTCGDHVKKLRRWLAAGQTSPDVKRKLELLLGRFGNKFSRS